MTLIRNKQIIIDSNWSLNGKILSGVIDPIDADHVANKAYVDSVAAGLDPKASVRFATTSNIEDYDSGTFTISGTTWSQDGVTAQDGDRVLVKDQDDKVENGIYTVSVEPNEIVLTRSSDFDGTPSHEVSAGNYTFVETGDTFGGTGWVVLGDGVLVVDSSPIVWSQFSESTSYNAGNAINISGDTISVLNDGTTIKSNWDNELYVDESELTLNASQISDLISTINTEVFKSDNFVNTSDIVFNVTPETSVSADVRNGSIGATKLNTTGIKAPGRILVATSGEALEWADIGSGGGSMDITPITYSNLKTLKTNNSLEPGTRYYITDREIWIDALDTDKLSMSAKRHFIIVKDGYYTPHTVSSGIGTTHYLGIYGQTIQKGSVPNSVGGINIGDRYYAIWGGRMWARNSSGSDIPGTSDQTIGGGWTLQATTTAFYESKIFNIKYDFDEDIIWEQSDDRGNIVTVTATGASYIDFIDWGNKLIFNNKCYGFRNNFRDSNPATIHNNYIDGYIANNSSNGFIRGNSNIGNIYKNTNGGAIQNNSNIGDITNNSNIGDITNNSIIGTIDNNLNNGSITNNSNASGITNIRFNRNNGWIRGNRMNGSYQLQYNNNNGNIGVTLGTTTRNADITDTIVNK